MIILLIMLLTLSLTLFVLLTGSQKLIFLTLFLSAPGIHSVILFIVALFIIGCSMLFILFLLISMGHHQKVSTYTAVDEPLAYDQLASDTIELILNNRTDTWHQFCHDLSDSDKMNYVLNGVRSRMTFSSNTMSLT